VPAWRAHYSLLRRLSLFVTCYPIRSARALPLHHEARRLRIAVANLTVMSSLRSTLGLYARPRPIVLSLSTLLVPLLASLYLLTENGAELHTREGSTQTLLKHLDEALLDAPWVAFEEAEAYKSHTKSARNAVEGSPAAAAVVRVDMTVNAPPRAVHEAFVKPELTKKWNSLVGEVKRLSASQQLQTYKFPWPLASREYVVDCRDQALRGYGFRTHCVPTEHPNAPRRADRVRGMSETLWQFTPVADDPERTKILFEGLVDPKGNVPKWLVDEIGKRASVSMVLSLARVAQAHAGGKPPRGV